MSAVAQAAATADALFIPDGSDAPDLVEALAANRVNVKRLQLLGSGLWADPSLSTASANGGANYGGATGSQTEAFYLRNNIIHGTRYAFSVLEKTMWNEDYNNFSTTDTTRGLEFGMTKYTTNLASYRWNTGQGAHTNLANDFVTTPALNNPLAGDMTLPASSPLVNGGVRVRFTGR